MLKVEHLSSSVCGVYNISYTIFCMLSSSFEKFRRSWSNQEKRKRRCVLSKSKAFKLFAVIVAVLSMISLCFLAACNSPKDIQVEDKSNQIEIDLNGVDNAADCGSLELEPGQCIIVESHMEKGSASLAIRGTDNRFATLNGDETLVWKCGSGTYDISITTQKAQGKINVRASEEAPENAREFSKS